MVTSNQKGAFGDYSPNGFGWILENIRALPEPIPFKGQQGLFGIDAKVLSPEVAA